MNKTALGIFAAFLALFAVAIPIWAAGKSGDPYSAAANVPTADSTAKSLFVTNCGACHTLAAAGTDGIVGPNLDDLLGVVPGQSARTLAAVKNGVAGRMPAGILQGGQAQQVADFVGKVAGGGTPGQ